VINEPVADRPDQSARCKAVGSAAPKILNRTVVTISAKDWAAFEAWIKRPTKVIPALAELARRTLSSER
jgi:hypothetical protein